MRECLGTLADIPHQPVAMQEVVNEAHGDKGIIRDPQVANEDGSQQKHCYEEKKSRRVFDVQVELDRLVVGVFLCQGMNPP